MARKEESPAFQWYPKDYLSSSIVARMSLAQEGAYRRLLDYQWMDGSVPEAIEGLAALCRVTVNEMRRLWPIMSECFQAHPALPGRLINDRLEKERAAQKARKVERQQSGKKGASTRWGDSSAIAQPSRKNSNGSELATAEPLATDASAFAIATASAESELKSAHSSSGARAEGGDFWIQAAWQRIRGVYPDYALVEIDGERAVFEACRLGRLRPDETPSDDPKSRTVSEFCAAITQWSVSDRWLGGKAKNLRNFIESGQYLNPPPPRERSDSRRAAGAHEEPQPSTVRRLG